MGIGTASPSRLLHLSGAAPEQWFVDTTDGSRASILYDTAEFTINVDAGVGAASSAFAVNVDNTERMRIDSTGNVGIGTASPTEELDVVGSIFVNDSNSTNSAEKQSIKFGGASGLTASLAEITGYRGANATFGELLFKTANGGAPAERMRIDASGNVGIGLASPASKLHLLTNSSSCDIRLQSGGAGNDTSMEFVSRNISNVAAYATIAADANHSSSNAPITFSQGASPVERMRIDSNGNVGIGTSSATNNLDVGISAVAAQQGISISNQGGIALASFTVDRVSGENQIGATRASYFPTFYSNGAEAMRIDTSGNVGIGTATPATMLDVKDPTVADGAKLRLRSTGAIDTNPTIGSLEFYSDDVSTSSSGLVGSIDTIGIGAWNGAGNNAAMTFNLIQGLAGTTSPVEAMRIDSSGNVRLTTANDTAGTSKSLQFGSTAFNRAEIRCTNAATFDGSLEFYTGNSTNFLERMRIDSSGNVGIGTSSPFGKAEIVGGTTGGSVYDTLVLTGGQSGVAGSGSRLTLSGANTAPLGRGAYIEAASTDAGNAHYLSFGTSASSSTPTERVRIDSSGNVNIGTRTVSANTALDNLVIQDLTGNAGFSVITGVAATGYYGFGDSADSYTGGMSYNHSNDSLALSANNAVRATIASSGDLLVGATAVGNGQNTAGVLLGPFNGDYGQLRAGRVSTFTGTASPVAFYHNGTYIGGLNTTTTTTSLVASSDERLKENIVDAPAGVVDSIQVRSFDWKATGEHQTYGFIAQELNTVAPFAVHHNEEEDAWGVDMAALVPMLVKEIQDLKAEVEALKNA